MESNQPRTLWLLEEDVGASPRATSERGPRKLDADNFLWNQFQPVVDAVSIFSSFVAFLSLVVKFAHIFFLDGFCMLLLYCSLLDLKLSIESRFGSGAIGGSIRRFS